MTKTEINKYYINHNHKQTPAPMSLHTNKHKCFVKSEGLKTFKATPEKLIPGVNKKTKKREMREKWRNGAWMQWLRFPHLFMTGRKSGHLETIYL